MSRTELPRAQRAQAGAEGIRAVVLDIEGTTTPLSFVKDRLFPFARRNLRAFVRARRNEPVVLALLDEAARLAQAEADAGQPADTLAALERWIDQDRKLTPLKALQGLLWDEAYRAGTLTSQVYDDVAPTLRALHARGLRLFVYSSGSVLAQKALFSHTNAGDLSPLFEGWFDTSVGSKTEARSYAAIAERVALPAHAILFLSDSEVELDAAREAGLLTIGVDRGERRLGGHALVTSFSALPPALTAGDAHELKAGVAALARGCHARGWSDATSGNFSARVDEARFAITRSGLDKGRAEAGDVLLVDSAGAAIESGRPSAETPLHLALYAWSNAVGAVAHTHSVPATVLSRRALPRGELRLCGFEMAKALPAISSHEAEIVLPVVENSQDVPALVERVRERLAAAPPPLGYLVVGHGLTTWGTDIVATGRHVEALEFLLRCALAEHAPG